MWFFPIFLMLNQVFLSERTEYWQFLQSAAGVKRDNTGSTEQEINKVKTAENSGFNFFPMAGYNLLS